MSWIRTAVNKAVDKYADSIVFHIAGGARILHDRIGFRNVQGFKHNVKRLEEVSVSCRGVERVQLLRRWLVSLKQFNDKRSFPSFDCDDDRGKSLREHPGFDDSKDNPQVYYADSAEDELKNFRDVFLYSKALEGITLSMILEAPNEEEVSLVLEIYGLCLAGGKEEQSLIMRKVQDLAEAFSDYREEVLIKREELLQFAQGAIAGLKINADLERIDAEACGIKEKLDRMKAFQHSSDEDTIPEAGTDLEKAFREIQLCCNLEAILLKKKSLSNGDSPEIHTDKVHKLKILLESLANSTSKAEKRILDHRSQKEEALSFRATKTNEVHQAEQDLVTEIRQLETKRDELESELKKVNSSLTVARKRLRHTTEERDQFDEASNQILVHLKSKEDELLRSIASSRAEAEVVDTCINFLEDTWVLKTSYTEQKEKQVIGDLERLGDHFVSLVIHLLSSYKENLAPLIAHIRELVENLSRIQRSKIPLGEEIKPSKATKSRKDLEDEYLDIEAKFFTTMSSVDTMEKQFYVPADGIFRKDDQKIKELFEAIEKLREEFESIERPILEIETPTKESDTPFNARNNKIPSTITKQTPETPKHTHDEAVHSSLNKVKKASDDRESELTVLVSEFDKDSPIDAAEDINDWEFDVLERD